MWSGPEKGSYYHELFLRGKSFLAARMKRTKIKGTSAQNKTGSTQSDPDFSSMPFLPPILTVPKAGAALQVNNEMALSPVRLQRHEFPLLSDHARLLSVRAQIPPAIPSPTTVAALTNQIIIQHAMMLKDPPSLSIAQSVLNQRLASLIPAMPHHATLPPPFGSRFILGGSNATDSNELWPGVPATGRPPLAPASSSFPVPAPPKQLDPAVFALFCELSDLRGQL